MSVQFCWCCGLPLDTRGACSLCDYVGVACSPPHECVKGEPRVIGPCHGDEAPDAPSVDDSGARNAL